MPDRGPKHLPGAKPSDDGPGASTDRHTALPGAASTLTDEEVAPDQPTTGPLPGAPRPVPVEIPTVPDDHAPVPRGASKSRLAAVPPRASKNGLPQVAERSPSKTALPQVAERSPSKTALPQVAERSASKTALPQVAARTASKAALPAVKSTGRSSRAIPVVKDDGEANTGGHAPLPSMVTESPTALRPSLGPSEGPTGPRQPITDVPTGSDAVVELSTDKRKIPGALQEDPAASTMGYRSLRYREPGQPLLDRQTRLFLGAAVVGTFLLGAILWKLASPKPPAPDLSAPRALPRSVAQAAKPLEPEKPAPPPPEKAAGVFLEEEVDLGGGRVKIVKIPAGTIQILSNIDVTISRNGIELGRTPLTITLPVGKNELLAVSKEQGLSRTMTLEVAAENESTRWTFSRGKLDVHAPAGTNVFVDGRAVGKGTIDVALWPGGHGVEVIFPKGDKETKKVQIEAGNTQSVYFEAPVHDSALAQ